MAYSLYSYDLPAELIAQRPVYPYDSARLLVVDRTNSSITESIFSKLANYLEPGDLLVFNDSKVIPARLYATVEPGGASAELLLIKELAADTWEVIGKPLKKIRTAERLTISPTLYAEVQNAESNQKVTLKFTSTITDRTIRQQLLSAGCMPIPPYIRKGAGDDRDLSDYQSLFARHEGSVAAPTASLHFTPNLLEQIMSKGCTYKALTLHVGTASFLPLYQAGSDNIKPPEAEQFTVPEEVADAVAVCKSAGSRVLAVGTTVVRALESMASKKTGATDLFIQPGYKFKVCDAIITNFHQPATTHLALVEAFLGRELLAATYQYALTHKFRFLSYGDGMLLI